MSPKDRPKFRVTIPPKPGREILHTRKPSLAQEHSNKVELHNYEYVHSPPFSSRLLKRLVPSKEPCSQAERMLKPARLVRGAGSVVVNL